MPDIVMFVPARKITKLLSLPFLVPAGLTIKTTNGMILLELLNYGNSNYEYRSFWQEPELSYILVENGILNDFGAGSSVYTGGQISVSDNEKNRQILISSDDRLQYQIRLKEHLSAPVRRGEQIGQIIYFLNDNKFFSCPILATENIQKNTFTHCAELVFKNFFH